MNKSGVIAGKSQDTITMLVTQMCRVRRLVPELASVGVSEHNRCLLVVEVEILRRPHQPRRVDALRVTGRIPSNMERLISELVDDANEL